MKTKYWIVIFLIIAIGCGILTALFFLPQTASDRAQILCDGQVLMTLDLNQNQTQPITTEYGTNTVEVKDGKIAVTQADCPDGYCMQRGWCDSGADIVCLPHRLVIRFLQSDMDLIVQ